MSYARFHLLYEALSVLGDYGLSRNDLLELQELTLEELDRLGQLSSRFMTITFDRKRFTTIKAQVRRQIELERTLLCAGAPFAMMRHFFGFTWQDFTARRKALGLQGDGIGRPSAPTDEIIDAVWQAWQKEARQVPSTHFGPEHYLAIHQVTGFPLRLIWTLVQQWSRERRVGPDSLLLVPLSPPLLDAMAGPPSACAQRA
jgi:hypothetical protein